MNWSNDSTWLGTIQERMLTEYTKNYRRIGVKILIDYSSNLDVPPDWNDSNFNLMVYLKLHSIYQAFFVLFVFSLTFLILFLFIL